MAGEHGGTGHSYHDTLGREIVLRNGVWVYAGTVRDSAGEVLNRAGDPVQPNHLPPGDIHNRYWDANNTAWQAWERQQGGAAPGPGTSSRNSAGSRGSGGGGDLMSLIHQAGFQGQAAQTMYAIVLAESGGNARAHNGNAGTGDNSYGLAQINMIGSMGPARLRQYGLSSNNDLFDPLTNLKVAFQLSNGGRNFSPWTTYTRGTYQQYMGQAGAQVTNGGTGNSSFGGSGSMQLSQSDLEAAFSDLHGIFQAVPELNHILQQAMSGGWDEARFRQAVEGTQWWKTHGDAAKQLVALRFSDPAEYQNQVNTARRTVQQMATQLGTSLSPDQLNALVQKYMTENWDSASLHQAVAGDLNVNGQLSGQFADYYQQLSQLYANYGIPVGDQMLRQRARQVAMTDGAQLNYYKQHAITVASSMYPAVAPQLQAGMTVKDIADPYVQTMGNLLETDPNGITLTDPLIKKALQGQIATSGGKVSTVTTPLWQFEEQLRKDPRWQYTNNARDTMSSAVTQIGRDFGFLAR